MSYGMNEWNKPDGDLISREAAIDDLHGKDPSQIWDTADIEVWVNALPSAQPERMRGKWIRRDRQDNKGKPLYGWYQCSECGAFIGSNEANFCSECGADMREDEQE